MQDSPASTQEEVMPKAKPLAIGIMGQAPMDPRACRAAFDDHIADREIRLIFALTARGEHNELPPVVKTLLDYAIEQELPYEVVTDETSAELADYEHYYNNAATKSRNVQRVGHRISNILGDLRDEGWDIELVLAWGGNEIGTHEDYAAIERCWAPGIHGGEQRAAIPVLDICNAFEPLEEDDPDTPADPSAPEPEEEPAVAEDETDDGEEESVPEDPEPDPEPTVLPMTSDEFDPAKSSEPLPTDMKAARKAGVRWWRDRIEECTDWSRRLIGKMTLEDCIELVYQPKTPDIDAPTYDPEHFDNSGAVDPDNIRPPLPASVPIPDVTVSVGHLGEIGNIDATVGAMSVPYGGAQHQIPSEDTVVGVSRSEMDQYAKDRAALLAGKSKFTAQIVLEIDLVEIIHTAATTGYTIENLLARQVLDALK